MASYMHTHITAGVPDACAGVCVASCANSPSAVPPRPPPLRRHQPDVDPPRNVPKRGNRLWLGQVPLTDDPLGPQEADLDLLAPPRPKRPTTALAAELLAQTRILNPRPKSDIAAARPNDSATPHAKA